MKRFILLFLTSILMLVATASCTTFAEDFDFASEVIQVEKSLVSYFDSDGNHWHCREALIYVDHQAKDVRFPIQYEGEIVSGTRIEWNCHDVTAYYVNGKKIPIDWDLTKILD